MDNCLNISAPASTPRLSLQSPPKEAAGLTTKRILVVDDDVVFLKTISLKLRAAGYDVLTAVDGAGAVSIVRQLKPDLILLDLNFPPDVAHGGGDGWNGLLILSWLRRMSEAHQIPVIAITASDGADCHSKCRHAGVREVFLKPIDYEPLLSSIRKALNQEEPPRAAAPLPPRKKILFIDDESDWRYMGALYLGECGLEVFTAES